MASSADLLDEHRGDAPAWVDAVNRGTTRADTDFRPALRPEPDEVIHRNGRR